MRRLNIEKTVLVVLAFLFGILLSMITGAIFWNIINNTVLWSMKFVVCVGLVGACIQVTLLTIAVFIIVKIKDRNEYKRW